ncbi:MAG: hypothetical protein ABIJ92_03315 [Candidatus Aenigmatarchaeota archaeon]
MKLFLIVIIIVAIIGAYFLPQVTLGGVIEKQTELIEIPIKVHVITDTSGYYTSARDQENIEELFKRANEILSQADIQLNIDEIVSTDVRFDAIPNTINGNYDEIVSHEKYDKEKINLILTQSLNGINGLALLEINSFLVSDFTTVNDYRTIAYEVGHLLGLRHVSPSSSLMARGRNGEILTKIEIETIRENALKFS